MKVAGIICEYNPFHNGHKHHILQTKKELNCDTVIALMSGEFTQRGDIAVFDVYSRANAALEGGADLVLSIPPQFVLQSAQFYAYFGVYILNAIGNVDYLSFGSECGDVGILENELDECDNDFLKENLKKGLSYCKSVSDSHILHSPNNILGVEYIKALRTLNSAITPHSVKRFCVSHNDDVSNGIYASASNIRRLIENKENFENFVPQTKFYDNPIIADSAKIQSILNYRLTLGDKDNFQNHLNISEGLNNRMIKYRNEQTFEEFVSVVCCKRYPKSRIRRAAYSIIADMKKTDALPSYTRVLAFNQQGQEFLNSVKKTSKIKIYSKITKKDIYENPQLQKELQCHNIIKECVESFV